jgi:hypothetical protein
LWICLLLNFGSEVQPRDHSVMKISYQQLLHSSIAHAMM